jgi:hypothetical protein
MKRKEHYREARKELGRKCERNTEVKFYEAVYSTV